MKETVRALWSAILLALIIIGIGGISWSTFQENSWPERVWGFVWEAEMRNPLLIIPIIGGVALTVWFFLRGGLAPGKHTVLSDILVYLLMACGAYYLYRWFFA